MVNIHKYDYGNPIAQKCVQEAIFSYPQIDHPITLFTTAAIEAVEHAFLVIDLWNEHAKNLNGWKPLGLIRNFTAKCCTALKKVWKKETVIHFKNATELKHILKIWPSMKSIDRYLFALLCLCGRFDTICAEENLFECIEILIKNQTIWRITTYKSLNGREFTFPWEYDCPLVLFKENTEKEKNKKKQEAKAREVCKTQTGIMKYFLPTKSQQIALKLDEMENNEEHTINANEIVLSQEMLQIIQELEETTDEDSDIEILPNKKTENCPQKWKCRNCHEYNLMFVSNCINCGTLDCPPTFGIRRKEKRKSKSQELN